MSETGKKGNASATGQEPQPTVQQVVKNKEGDIVMPTIEVNNTVALTRTIKVALPPKFKGDLSRLKEYIAKLQIYISYYNNSFDLEADKVLFAISYLEERAFSFIETYLDNFQLYLGY